jgi:hypothetical protein
MGAKAKELNMLLKYYEDNLCDKIFKYELNNKINIDIIFYRENLCHLLGVQHIFKKDKRYLGLNGFNKIINNELTIRSLKAHNEKEYNKMELRFIYFDTIYELLSSGKILKFYQYRCKPSTIISADFVIFKDQKEYVLHLFLRKEQEGSNQYTPVSFIVKSPHDKRKYQFIECQETKKVTYFEIVTTKHQN